MKPTSAGARSLYNL